jgi:uncharacterized membrane protein YjfL (UPF0719 family)
MDPIGPAEEHQFPRNCFLLGDTIYPSQHPLVTPYTNAQLRRQDNNTRRKSVEVTKQHCIFYFYCMKLTQLSSILLIICGSVYSKYTSYLELEQI